MCSTLPRSVDTRCTSNEQLENKSSTWWGGGHQPRRPRCPRKVLAVDWFGARARRRAAPPPTSLPCPSVRLCVWHRAACRVRDCHLKVARVQSVRASGLIFFVDCEAVGLPTCVSLCCDGFRTLTDHISITTRGRSKSSSDLERGAAPRSTADEFSDLPLVVIEIWSIRVLKPSQSDTPELGA